MRIPILAAVLGSLAGPALAGPQAQLYFEQSVRTRSDGRETGAGVVSRVWRAGPRMRLEAGEPGGPAFVLQLDTGRAYRLDPTTRTALVLDAERLRARASLDLEMAADLLGGSDELRVRVTPLRATRIVAGYSCRSYRLSAGRAELELCLTEALPVGIEAFADFLEWSGAAAALGPLLTEMRTLRGFPLETRSRVTLDERLQETLATVTRVTVGPQPAHLFEPPFDYRLLAEPAETEGEP